MARRVVGASTQNAELTAALEAAVVRELRTAWHQFNEALFGGGLRAPTLELVTSRATLGRWIAATRTLEISRPLVVEQPWGAVLEVLKHEMAHQYVHEVLRETADAPHGSAFRDACARLGIEARASGVPDVRTAPGDRTEDRVVTRIARLLALADSPNRNEAEAAMAAAQRLMLKYNLEQNADVPRPESPRDYAFVHLGEASGRIGEHERLVAMILGKYFFVEVIWVPVYRPLAGKRGSVLEVCGARANLATAQYVHGFLHDTAERLWREHKASRGIGSDRERRAFLAGVMTGFADKLTRQSAESRSEGLVWVRDGDLETYFRRRHPHVRHVRHSGQRRSNAWVDGRAAGQRIILHRPIDAATSSRGRLLVGKR